MSSVVPAGLLGAASSAKAASSATPRPRVEVFDGSTGAERPLDVLKGTDHIVRQAHDNALKVDAFLRTSFKRDGWDGKGTPLRVVVHTPAEDGGKLNNAFWDNDRGKVYLGDGDGTIFAPLGNSLDVLTHEVAHAIVDSEVNLRYDGQQGGINESWADVLGSLNDPDDWLIGEDVFTPGRSGDAIRDLANPRFGNTRSLPPGADIDVHDLSGIPSLAAVRVADAIGREQMGQIWYRALTDHLSSRSGFAGAARATLQSAAELYGADSKQFSAVNDAWKAVGVNPRFRLKGTPEKA